jgi:hypothetical protein
MQIHISVFNICFMSVPTLAHEPALAPYLIQAAGLVAALGLAPEATRLA